MISDFTVSLFLIERCNFPPIIYRSIAKVNYKGERIAWRDGGSIAKLYPLNTSAGSVQRFYLHLLPLKTSCIRNEVSNTSNFTFAFLSKYLMSLLKRSMIS